MREGRFARTATVSVVFAALTALTVGASAASLGGVSIGSLFAQESPVAIEIPNPPRPVVSTDFSGCTNLIDQWTDESGATWTSHSGNWQCLGGNVVRSRDRAALASLTVGIPHSAGIQVSTDIFDISQQSGRSGPGLALFGDGSGRMVYVIYERDQDRFTLGVLSPSNGHVVIDQIGPISDLDTAIMAAEIEGTIVTVLVDGIVLGSYDLATVLEPLDQDYFLDNTRFGLVADDDNFSRFDHFTIELLP